MIPFSDLKAQYLSIKLEIDQAIQSVILDSAFVLGKYSKQFAEGTNLVVLAPDVLKNFPDSDSVNETLRAILKIAQRSKKRLAA